MQGRVKKLRIGVDSGGTFTDFILDFGGRVELVKVPSTPSDPAAAILSVLQNYTANEVVHGSTVATNALLERRHARAAFVTNIGFEDLLDIGRQDRPDIYDLQPSPVAPLIPREDRFGICGRMAAGGKVLEDLDCRQLEQLASRLAAGPYQSVAVGLLHSTENGDHERRAGEILAAAGYPVILSCEAAAEPREWERFTTACASAVLTPVMQDYLQRLDQSVSPALLKVMDSCGAAVPWQRISNRAVRTVLSGPAGGVVAAATRAGKRSAISFDMGGTSTDVALVENGQRAARNHRFSVGGIPLAVPLLEVHTVGAGGGSLAWIDAGGALRVGPRSAGADPGPAAYQRGGTEATVTDAHIVLGRIPADLRLGGTLSLDVEAALKAMSKLAARLGLTVEATACGIIEVVDAEMERALRRVSQERGADPRGMTMVCFGGAGGLHAVSLARSCGMGEIRLPAAAGVLSAIGMLEAPWSEEVEQVMLRPLGKGSDAQLDQLALELAEIARKKIRQSGGDESAAVIETTLRGRHVGQAHEMEYLPGDDAESTFRDLYEQRYGYRMPDRDIEAVSIRVSATIPSAGISASPAEPEGEATTASVVLDATGRRTEVPRVHHGSIRQGQPLTGPAMITSSTTTLWLPEGASLRCDDKATLIINPGSV